jgi:beta-xylosidase
MTLRLAIVWLFATCLALPPTSARAEHGPVALRRVPGSERGGAVHSLGDIDNFDAEWVTCPTILREDGVYRMWYSSLCDAKDGPGGIGLATSRDGIHWQRANGGKPVLTVGPPAALADTPAALNSANIMGPCVLHVGDRYLMWYTGMSTARHSSGFGFYRIFLASSPDGIQWQRENNGQPVLDLGPPSAPDAVQAATPVVLLDPALSDTDGKTFRMWYAAWSPTHNHTICTATSSDGLHWTRDATGRPITGLNPPTAYGHALSRIGDDYLLLYMSLAQTKGLYAATSTDGQNWSMLNHGKPILNPGPTASFDSLQPGHPTLLREGNTLKVWYTGYERTTNERLPLRLTIGLAEIRIEDFLNARQPQHRDPQNDRQPQRGASQ